MVMSSSAGIILAFQSENSPRGVFRVHYYLTHSTMFLYSEQCFLFSQIGNWASFFLLVTKHIFFWLLKYISILICHDPVFASCLPGLKSLLQIRSTGGLWVKELIRPGLCPHRLQNSLCTFPDTCADTDTALVPKGMSYTGKFEYSHAVNPSSPSSSPPNEVPTIQHVGPVRLY